MYIWGERSKAEIHIELRREMKSPFGEIKSPFGKPIKTIFKIFSEQYCTNFINANYPGQNRYNVHCAAAPGGTTCQLRFQRATVLRT